MAVMKTMHRCGGHVPLTRMKTRKGRAVTNCCNANESPQGARGAAIVAVAFSLLVATIEQNIIIFAKCQHNRRVVNSFVNDNNNQHTHKWPARLSSPEATALALKETNFDDLTSDQRLGRGFGFAGATISQPLNKELNHIANIKKQSNNIIQNDELRRQSAERRVESLVSGHHYKQHRHHTFGSSARAGQLQFLPNGPPPFRPTSMLINLGQTGILDKLKKTKIFKRMYKSKVYYLFLDALQQLTILVDKIARKKIDITGANMAAIHAVANKFALKGGHALKMKWPLVMLNPHFIKEILANPTFLVMLFHAIEVAYMSMPVNFWLKPLVKLVHQPGPDKEEQIWWRRKRLYDALNGHGSSELQPNLKSRHFKNPGEPAPIAFPSIVNIFRQFWSKQAPNPNHYHYPASANYPPLQPPPSMPLKSGDEDFSLQQLEVAEFQLRPPQPAPPLVPYAAEEVPVHQQSVEVEAPYYTDDDKPNSGSSSNRNISMHNLFMTSAQEEQFLANQMVSAAPMDHLSLGSALVPATTERPLVVGGSDYSHYFKQQATPESGGRAARPPVAKMSTYNTRPSSAVAVASNWLARLPSSTDQLMSQAEFDSLDPRERELVVEEAQNRIKEAELTNELIMRQNEFVESFVEQPGYHRNHPYNNREEAAAAAAATVENSFMPQSSGELLTLQDLLIQPSGPGLDQLKRNDGRRERPVAPTFYHVEKVSSLNGSKRLHCNQPRQRKMKNATIRDDCTSHGIV